MGTRTSKTTPTRATHPRSLGPSPSRNESIETTPRHRYLRPRSAERYRWRKEDVLVAMCDIRAGCAGKRTAHRPNGRPIAQRNVPRHWSKTIAISGMISMCISRISIELHRGSSSSVQALDRPLDRTIVATRSARSVCIRRGSPGRGWMALGVEDGGKPSVVSAAFVDGLARAHA